MLGRSQQSAIVAGSSMPPGSVYTSLLPSQFKALVNCIVVHSCLVCPNFPIQYLTSIPQKPWAKHPGSPRHTSPFHTSQSHSRQPCALTPRKFHRNKWLSFWSPPGEVWDQGSAGRRLDVPWILHGPAPYNYALDMS